MTKNKRKLSLDSCFEGQRLKITAMNTPRQDEFWEDRLRQTIRDAESDPEAQAWDTPSEAVWEQVSEVLEEKRRRLPLLLWWGSLAAGVLLTVGGLWLVAENQLQLRSQQAEKTEQQISGKEQLHPEKAVSEAPSISAPSATNTEIPGQQRSSRQGKPERSCWPKARRIGSGDGI